MSLTRTFTVVPVVRWVVRESTSHPEQGAGGCGDLAELRNEQDARRVAKAMTDASGAKATGCYMEPGLDLCIGSIGSIGSNRIGGKITTHGD